MMKIRKLDPEEIYDAQNLIKEVFFAEGNLGYPREGAKAFLEFVSAKGELLEYFGAYDTALEGVLGYTEDYHLALLFVRREHQKTGIGLELFQAFKEEAKKHAVARITVNAAESAAGFYSAVGFEPYGPKETKDGITSVPMEYLMAEDALGRHVTVMVDRPYGSLHPHYPDTEYPCNYGYVEEVLAGDGEFQDAYVIGVYEPVETFSGVVAAVIYRRNDCESKWVVTQDGTCDRQEVIDTVGVIEQYFDTRIIWLEDHRLS